MQKVSFICDTCEAKGSVRIPDDYDDYRVEFCPCCGSPLPEEDYDEDDE
jgi:hypothetical protein